MGRHAALDVDGDADEGGSTQTGPGQVAAVEPVELIAEEELPAWPLDGGTDDAVGLGRPKRRLGGTHDRPDS